MNRSFAFGILLVPALLLGSGAAFGQTGSYQDYQYSRRQVDYFSLTFTTTSLTVTTYAHQDSSKLFVDDIKRLQKSPGSIAFQGNILFNDTALVAPSGEQFPFDRITDTRIANQDGTIVIRCLTRPQDDNFERFRQGNRVSFAEPIAVAAGEFSRGLALSIQGDVRVAGEVNKDVISLFGNVVLDNSAVVRGDIASLSGRIDISDRAVVYGEIYEPGGSGRLRSQRLTRLGKGIEVVEKFDYNRVDGFGARAGLKFSDPDSALPTAWADFGYAFESERIRFEVGAEQTILRRPSLAVGVRGYQQLVSEDDWLITNSENRSFALLATEDFKDYIETRGFEIYARVMPVDHLSATLGFTYENSNYIPATNHLWSLFGGSKLFRDNFSSIDRTERTMLIPIVEGGKFRSVDISVVYDSRDRANPFASSAWHASIDLEFAQPTFDSYFSYKRYLFALRRYQKTSSRSMALGRLVYGETDGLLPFNKTFFLGGLGTLRGYNHKEFQGSNFLMANMEYRYRLLKFQLALAVIYDAGQISRSELTSEAEIRQSIGLAGYLGEDVKVSLARRLDGADDKSLEIYVRFDHLF